MRKLKSHDFGNHQRVMESQQRRRLNDSCLKSPGLYMFLFFRFDCTFIGVSMPSSWQYSNNILWCCLAPVFIDAILQLDDGKVANFIGYGVIKKYFLYVARFVIKWSNNNQDCQPIPVEKSSTCPVSPSSEAVQCPSELAAETSLPQVLAYWAHFGGWVGWSRPVLRWRMPWRIAVLIDAWKKTCKACSSVKTSTRSDFHWSDLNH